MKNTEVTKGSMWKQGVIDGLPSFCFFVSNLLFFFFPTFSFVLWIGRFVFYLLA